MQAHNRRQRCLCQRLHSNVSAACHCITGCRFGRQEQAEDALRNWLRHVASSSPHAPDAAALSRGSIGEPSGAYEVELEFDDLSALQHFWGSLDGPEQRAWLRQAEVWHASLPVVTSPGVARPPANRKGRPVV